MSQTRLVARPSNMKRLFAALIALAMAGNGLVMLLAGRWWYGAVPGVPGTGPFNPHFVKDIGAAYLVAGVSFAWLAARPDPAARGAALAGAAFLAAHAGIHLAEAFGNPNGLAELSRDVPGVIAPALIGLVLAWPRASKSET
jgi:hypothetical protein